MNQAMRRPPPAATSGGRARYGAFASRNPFDSPLTLGFFYREKMRAIHRVAPEEPLREILEVGGGQGGLTALLYPEARIANLDFDASFAAAPANRQPQVRFLGGDATALPFADESFDAVTMFDLLEHVPDGPVCPPEEAMFAEWGHVRRGYSLAQLKPLVGLEPERTATFINPVAVVCHDIAFSRLPRRLRKALCTALLPLTWVAYALHRPATAGTANAVTWLKPRPGEAQRAPRIAAGS